MKRNKLTRPFIFYMMMPRKRQRQSRRCENSIEKLTWKGTIVVKSRCLDTALIMILRGKVMAV